MKLFCLQNTIEPRSCCGGKYLDIVFAKGKFNSELKSSGLIRLKACYPNTCISRVVIIFQTNARKNQVLSCGRVNMINKKQSSFSGRIIDLTKFATT